MQNGLRIGRIAAGLDAPQVTPTSARHDIVHPVFGLDALVVMLVATQHEGNTMFFEHGHEVRAERLVTSAFR